MLLCINAWYKTSEKKIGAISETVGQSVLITCQNLLSYFLKQQKLATSVAIFKSETYNTMQ